MPSTVTDHGMTNTLISRYSLGKPLESESWLPHYYRYATEGTLCIFTSSASPLINIHQVIHTYYPPSFSPLR